MMRDFMITSSVLITAVLLIRRLTKKKLHPVWQYALWLPVVVRLIIPVPFWSSSFGVLNLLPGQAAEGIAAGEGSENGGNTWQKDGGREAAGTGEGAEIPDNTGLMSEAGMPDKTPNSLEAGIPDGAGSPARADVLDRSGVIPEYRLLHFGIWPYIRAAGTIFIGCYMLFYQIKWKRYLSANRKPLRGREKYRGTLSVYTVRNLPSPCLSGRCIYLTKEMAGNVKQLEHILAHEYCHYRHFDSLWVIVRCVLVAVYWFHPLVWAAALASKQDSELACDAAAIRLLGEQERLAYGKTLLRLAAADNYGRSRVGIASTMSGRENGIKERISHIAGKPGYVAVTAGIVLLFMAAVVAFTFSGTGKEPEKDSIPERVQNMPENFDIAEEAEKARREVEQEVQRIWQLQEQQQEALRNQEQEFQKLQQAMEAEIETDAVLKKLALYDAKIEETGSQPGVCAVRDALDPSDYVQAFDKEGEAALEEGMYLLEVHKGPDGSDIRLYGMYSKDYGCRGIKILTGEDAEDFDEVWFVSYLHGMEENLRLYESGKDGMPRTFACKVIAEESSETEVWNLYLCDRRDTGAMELCVLRPGDFIGEISERLRFEIDAEACKIDVYDREKLVGRIAVNASPEAMKSIQEVVVDGSSVSWFLGKNESEIKMITAVGLKLDGTGPEGTEAVWYHSLPLLSFPVTCGSFGERQIRFGQAAVDTEYVNAGYQGGADSLDQFLKLMKEAD